jgi:hypothetical protein
MYQNPEVKEGSSVMSAPGVVRDPNKVYTQEELKENFDLFCKDPFWLSSPPPFTLHASPSSMIRIVIHLSNEGTDMVVATRSFR